MTPRMILGFRILLTVEAQVQALSSCGRKMHCTILKTADMKVFEAANRGAAAFWPPRTETKSVVRMVVLMRRGGHGPFGISNSHLLDVDSKNYKTCMFYNHQVDEQMCVQSVSAILLVVSPGGVALVAMEVARLAARRWLACSSARVGRTPMRHRERARGR